MKIKNEIKMKIKNENLKFKIVYFIFIDINKNGYI